jgi:AcrR family transcriptional regulator
MKKSISSQISTRKQPKQSRAVELVDAILEAAVQVLRTEGAQRFTTARVAERAGVSVGSLYQYFPNKAAILFRLQTDEWRKSTGLHHIILTDEPRPPLERLRALVRFFLQAECDEAEMRMALHDAAPHYRNAPETNEAKASDSRVFQAFMQEILPDASETECLLAGNLIMTTLSLVGKRFSESPRTHSEIAVFADAMSDMFCAYLKNIKPK